MQYVFFRGGGGGGLLFDDCTFQVVVRPADREIQEDFLLWFLLQMQTLSFLISVIAEIFVCDLISYFSYFWLKVRNLVAC